MWTVRAGRRIARVDAAALYAANAEGMWGAAGTPLPAEQGFVTDFESLRTTGDYPG